MPTPRVITLSRQDTMPDLSGPVAAGIWGVVHRATTGLRTFDTSYNAHFQMAADAGLLWGAGHLGDNSNAQQQALSFVNWAMRAPLLVLEYDTPPISPDGDKTMPPDIQHLRGLARIARSPLERWSAHMTNWPNDDTASKVKFFGDPRLPGFEDKYLTLLTPPFQMYYDKHPVRAIRCNKAVAASLLRVFGTVWEAASTTRSVSMPPASARTGGAITSGRSVGATTMSNHSFGAAIDLDPERNPLGARVGAMPKLVIDAFKAEGWLWGGDYGAARTGCTSRQSLADPRVAVSTQNKGEEKWTAIKFGASCVPSSRLAQVTSSPRATWTATRSTPSSAALARSSWRCGRSCRRRRK
jgi:hypothetical protein